MKVGYLLNSYPMTSTTFIRREITALEELGVEVVRYAVRPWAEEMVDAADKEEAARTHYILAGNIRGLATALLASLFSAPAQTFKGLRGAWRLWRGARGGPGADLVRHGAYFLQAVYLARRANRDGVAHIHAHFATNAAAVAMLSRLMDGPSYSFTVHGPHDLFDAPLLSIADKIENAAFVAAITRYCASQLRLHAARDDWEKIRIVGCGVFLDEFSAAPATDAQTLVCVGRLCPEKGQLALPAIASRLADAHPELRIELVGDGPDRAPIEAAIAEYGVEDRFTLLGWRDNAEVAERVKNARALLLPSYAEGLPVVIMEAFARGRPVISTYIAGIPELVDATCGWLAPASDDAALEAAIRDALAADVDLLAKMGREGRARVESRHDQRVNAERLKHLFEETS
ncbi:MAG: glycosyltransferase [Pseudomonadota bacterium]